MCCPSRRHVSCVPVAETFPGSLPRATVYSTKWSQHARLVSVPMSRLRQRRVSFFGSWFVRFRISSWQKGMVSVSVSVSCGLGLFWFGLGKCRSTNTVAIINQTDTSIPIVICRSDGALLRLVTHFLIQPHSSFAFRSIPQQPSMPV